MTLPDDYFPRGGIKRKAAEPAKKIAKSENLFNVNSHKKSTTTGKRARKIRKGDDDEGAGFDTNLRLSSVDTLSYKKIREGMLVLGCIRKIKSVCLDVELPGRTHGLVMIKNISEPFSKELLKQLGDSKDDTRMLNKIFTPGQFLPTKVLSVEEDDRGTRLRLSADPRDVNSALRHTQVKTGTLVWGAVSEKHDHGYVVDLGIPDCRALLPNDGVDADKQYGVGQVFYSVIVKCENAKHATTVTLSALGGVIEDSCEDSELSLDHVVPGMQVNYTINKIVKHGLEGTLLNDCTGYVNDLYLTYPLENIKNYKEGQAVKARVMYVQPSTKFSYLMLRNLDVVEPPKLKLGAKMNCQVRERISNGLVVKISTDQLGFVTYKRIIKSLSKSDGDFKQIISGKYAVGSQHHCVVIGYNHLEKMYICTFETDVLKEGYFAKDDLEVGQEVNGVVTEIKPQGLIVKMGNIEGFVDNLHLSSGIYSDKMKGKFKAGQRVKARVWYIDDASDNIQLTMKPELLKDGQLLDENEKDKEFLGVVAKPTKAGVMVVFFGNKRAWLPSTQIPQLSGNDASNIFYKGQAIQCYVLNCKDGKIVLTLKHKLKTVGTALELGTRIKSARVTSVKPVGLELFCEEKGVPLFLPAEHLTSTLGTSVLDTYKDDDIVENLVCISPLNKAVVSLKEISHFRALSLSEVEEGTILRCYYKRRAADGIIVFTPISDYQKIFIYSNALDADVEFSPYQVVYCKIIRFGNVAKGKQKKIFASAMLGEVFKYDRSSICDHLDEHLRGMDLVRERLKLTGEALADLEMGQVVNCVVNKVDKKRGCSVIIKPSQCNGIVELDHMTGDLKPKDRCRGVVIGIDYERKFALISLKKYVIEKVSAKAELPDSSEMGYAHLLTVNGRFALGVHSSGHLIYLPVQLHPNDHGRNSQHYSSLLNKKIKVVHCKVSCGRLLGFEKGLDKTRMTASKKNNKTSSVKQKRKKKPVERKEDKSPLQPVEDGGSSSGDDGEIHDENVEDSESDEEVLVEKAVVENDEETDTGFTLPGMTAFFETSRGADAADNTSCSDDDETEDQPAKKKKKLSNAERATIAKTEEQRLQKIENELAESSALPQSAEQFDRVLLGNPDDSEMWLRYIAFHTQSTELEKARAVVKRALEKISYNATQDRLNVWLAYLNLENMYGTKATFEKVFEEACRCNETLTIYLESIQMLSEMQKFSEMDEKIKKARTKFKEELKMWLEIAKVYYKCKRYADARKLKDVAITTISNKKTHVDLLVQFAILEFAEGEAAQGEALFETIIQTDPKRVDVWCTYVDQLIKGSKIDIARSVLSRAVGQKLIYKKMRTLFKKYIAFEKEHGDEETLMRATKLLKEYTD